MKAIVAMGPYRVIGNKGKLPWHLPEDFKWFKKVTMDSPLLMGRTTYQSLGVSHLPNRFIYILTHDTGKLDLPSTYHVAYTTERQVFDMPYQFRDRIWVCGGASVYQRFLPLCDEVYVTHVLDDYDGDTYMPEFEHGFPEQTIIREAKGFWIVKYAKRNDTRGSGEAQEDAHAVGI